MPHYSSIFPLTGLKRHVLNTRFYCKSCLYSLLVHFYLHLLGAVFLRNLPTNEAFAASHPTVFNRLLAQAHENNRKAPRI